ncbi:DUF6878 family protein [Agitococcus lubricus]|uniref:DUF6878 domain-containing protein n=1 Tax=Agitococcus lubricus TaxID=1077255 RepID=A0A2T5IJM5_9GAMM|nr:DUF6878 family protein [Agitococcus lubricus]PTQ84033.1 hypothetical protein C8N29_1642 [Agitococcus lubricus]
MMGYSPKSFEAVRANRQPLLDALAALAITQLVVRYEGGGDSGDVSELEIFPESLAQANIANTLKVEQLTYHCLADEYQDGEYRYFLQEQQSSIDSALRDFVLTWVDAHHGGWENNDGGSGTMTINVTEGTFRLEHTEYYTECSNYEYDL